jgi:hypothetical protein
MALNKSTEDNMVMRRELVAQFRLRGMTLSEISKQLAKKDIINPTTKKPYSDVTILNDLEALKQEWRANAEADISEHQARQVAEVAEIKRAAWAAKDPELALKALDREMKILGTMKQTGGITINIEIVNRFADTAKELGIDPSKALEEYIQALHAQHQDSGGTSSLPNGKARTETK